MLNIAIAVVIVVVLFTYRKTLYVSASFAEKQVQTKVAESSVSLQRRSKRLAEELDKDDLKDAPHIESILRDLGY